MNFFKKLFNKNTIRGDVFGGITAGIVALPLALAFGVQSGLGASAGLYGAIFIGFFAALFGGTSTQISGPTAPMTAVSMVVIAGIIQANDGNLDEALPSILTVFLLAGVIQILLGVVGLGQYIEFIPYPVVSGFMTGIGVIIIITQLLPMIGYYPAEDQAYVEKFKPEAEEVILEKILRDEAREDILVLEDFKETVRRADLVTEEEIQQEAKVLAKKDSSGVIGAIRTLPRAISNINYLDLILALITIFIIYGFKWITTKVPSTLVALLAVSAGVVLLGMEYRSIDEIPSGFPLMHLSLFLDFSFSDVSPFLFSAVTLALLGAIDSLLTSVVADKLTKTFHNPNRELMGQGIGNGVAALFGGIPGAGATIRTVVNINSGGKTRLSGMIAALLLLVVLLLLGPLASQIPAAVLAGILITVGIGVMDHQGIKVIPRMQFSEVVIMLTVLILTVTWDLVYAVGIGLVIAALVFMKRMAEVAIEGTTLGSLQENGDKPWLDELNIPEEVADKIYIKHLFGPLFFGFTSKFQQISRNLTEDTELVVIRMERVPYIDQSGSNALEDVIRDLHKKDIKVLLTGLRKQPRERLKTMKIIPDLIPGKFVFKKFKYFIDQIPEYIKTGNIISDEERRFNIEEETSD